MHANYEVEKRAIKNIVSKNIKCIEKNDKLVQKYKK